MTSHVYPQSRLSGPRLRLSCDVASKQNLWGGYMETMVMGVSLCVWWALGLIGPVDLPVPCTESESQHDSHECMHEIRLSVTCNIS